MKALLNAAKSKLRTDIAYVKDRDVYVTEDLRMVRASGDYPAIGLKDGGTSFMVESGDQVGETLSVQIGCYVKLYKAEAAVMGDDSAGENGLLEIAADIKTVMDGTFNGTVDLAEPVGISASEILFDERKGLQFLYVTMRYTRWR